MAQLAKLIREKYPDAYKDMSDEDLEKAVVAKYPQYADLVTEPEVKGDMSLVPQPTFGEPTASIVPEKPKPLAKPKDSFIKRLGTSVVSAATHGPIAGLKTLIDPYIEENLPTIIPQLSGEEEGVLNPNLSMNPLLMRSFLPETEESPINIPENIMGVNVPDIVQEKGPDILGSLRHELYEGLVRPTVSPLGLYSSLPALNPAEHPSLSSTVGIESRGASPIKLVPGQPRIKALLPERTEPSFISGEEGVAINRPYPVEKGPLPDVMSGTVLPQEFGQVVDLPPEIAAQYGLAEGSTVAAKPIRFSTKGLDKKQLTDMGAEIANWIKQGYRLRKTGKGNEFELVPPTIGPRIREQGRFTGQNEPAPYLGEGTARPGEPQLPSAPPRIKSMPEKPITGEELLGSPAREAEATILGKFDTPEANVVANTPPPPLVSPITGEPVNNIVSAARSGSKKTRNPKVMNNEGDRQSALAKLIDSLFESRPLRAQQEKIYSAARAKKFAAAAQVKATGEKGFYTRLSQMKGELPKVEFESIRPKLNENDVNTLFDLIQQTPGLTDGQKLRAGTGLAKLLGEFGGVVPQNNEINLLFEVFSQFGDDATKAFGSALRARMPRGRKFESDIAKVTSFRKAIMASYDLSAPLRQGLPLIHRTEWWNSWGDMVRAFGSEDAYQTFRQVWREHPDYKLADKAGLELTDTLTDREEMFNSQMAEKIPLIGRGVRASNRAYTTFLNKLRIDTFKSLLDKAEDTLDPNIRMNEVFARELANFLNTSTGRGNLGKWAGAAERLNMMFFSPKLMASRFQMLDPTLSYYKLNPFRITPEDFTPEMNFIRKEKLKALLSVGSVITTMGILGKLAGADIVLDPRSADFMKVKIGDTRFDFGGGFLQYAVLYSRLATGKQTSSISGQTIEYGSRYGFPTRLDAIENFFTNKAAPEFGLLLRGLIGKGPQGEPINWPEEHINRSIPILMQDLWEIMQEDPSLVPFIIPSIFGAGVQHYERERPKGF